MSGFSYRPRAASDPVDEAPVDYVELRHHEHAGPFWSREESLSDDFDDWQPLGMTRSTFDACHRWNDAGGDEHERQALLALLSNELTGVVVEGEVAGDRRPTPPAAPGRRTRTPAPEA